mmetsp:Transcript_6913/g.14277  ORF Transcript_6913/g.14277 Transcript_6913/m.14277 type:complete len:760 (+) Transcript_6913:1453-3732(+)
MINRAMHGDEVSLVVLGLEDAQRDINSDVQSVGSSAQTELVRSIDSASSRESDGALEIAEKYAKRESCPEESTIRPAEGAHPSSEESGKRWKGRIVNILHHNPEVHLMGKFHPGKDDACKLLFQPKDVRYPLGLVKKDKVADLAKRAGKKLNRRFLEGHLFVVEYGKWQNGMFPTARSVTFLGKDGDLTAESRGFLLKHNIMDCPFPREVLADLPSPEWCISDLERSSRLDLRHLVIFSIDPETARDLDDALSIEDLPDGIYRVGVHVADVSHFVKEGTSLDEHARKRSTSTYLVDRVIPMLPRALCEDLCSLNPGTERLAFSVFMNMTNQGKILKRWFGRSVIKSRCKLSYKEAQSIIDQDKEPTTRDGGWKEKVKNDIKKLHQLAMHIRSARFENGSLRLRSVQASFQLNERGQPIGFTAYPIRESNYLIEEFMLLANMSVAQYISSAFPGRSLLRCHLAPKLSACATLERWAKRWFDIELEWSSPSAVHHSLARLEHVISHPTIFEAFQVMGTKVMETARYFCTGCSSSWRHFALNFEKYTHFTSPIRRYPDIIVHRQLQEAIDRFGNDGIVIHEQVRNGQTHDEFCDQLSKWCTHFNERKKASTYAQSDSTQLFLRKLFSLRPQALDSAVVDFSDRFIILYIPSTGDLVQLDPERARKEIQCEKFERSEKCMEFTLVPLEKRRKPFKKRRGLKNKSEEENKSSVFVLDENGSNLDGLSELLHLKISIFDHVKLYLTSNQTSLEHRFVISSLTRSR